MWSSFIKLRGTLCAPLAISYFFVAIYFSFTFENNGFWSSPWIGSPMLSEISYAMISTLSSNHNVPPLTQLNNWFTHALTSNYAQSVEYRENWGCSIPSIPTRTATLHKLQHLLVVASPPYYSPSWNMGTSKCHEHHDIHTLDYWAILPGSLPWSLLVEQLCYKYHMLTILLAVSSRLAS